MLPGAPLRRTRRLDQGEAIAAPKPAPAQAVRAIPRHFGHVLMLALALLVALAGNAGRMATDWQSLALDRAAELPSAFAHPQHPSADDVLLKPPAPLTQLVNRPREGIAIHRVEEGETVSAIADKYEISLATVLWANRLAEEDLLPPGRELIILPVSGVLHTVKAGEQVEVLARRYQTDVQAIVEFNQLTDPQAIVANDVLVIPGGRPEERPRPLPSARGDARPKDDLDEGLASLADTASAAAAGQPMEASSYTVAEGDNLNSIAQKFGVSVETIIWANGLQDDPELITEGQALTILPVSGAFHTVAEGDSLLQVALRHGVEMTEIIAANALASADALAVDQKLIIPGARLADPAEVRAQARAAAAQALANSGPKYTVAPGDSLLAIAQRHGVDASVIVRANGLGSADLLRIGQELVIPGGRSIAVAAAPAPKPAAPPAPKPAAPAPKPAAPAPQPAPAAPPPAPAADGSRIVTIASRYLGYAYSWGGHSPSTGFDCSGFTWYVYQQAGIRIPMHDLWGQLQAGPRISQANLQPGDLVFFQNTYQPGLSHSGIYIGGGRFINAQDYGKGVRVASVNDSYWGPRYLGASRPW